MDGPGSTCRLTFGAIKSAKQTGRCTSSGRLALAGIRLLNFSPDFPGKCLELATSALVRYRRRVIAGLVVALTGFGITAFGIAPLAPDAAQLPQRWISESVLACREVRVRWLGVQ